MESIEKEINIIYYLKLLWKRKVLIFSVTLIFSLASVFYSLWLPNIYSSSATLALINDPKGGSNQFINSQLGSIASLANINMETDSIDRFSMASATIFSRDFASKLYLDDEIVASMMAVKKYDKKTKKLEYDESEFNPFDNKWVDKKPTFAKFHKELKQVLNFEQDKRFDVIYLSFDNISPEFSYNMVNLILTTLDKDIRTRDLKKSDEALEYLNAQYSSTQNAALKNSLNFLIQNHLETQMLANIGDFYYFDVIDQAYIPFYKKSPSRALICILGFMLGLLTSILFVLFKQIISKSENS